MKNLIITGALMVVMSIMSMSCAKEYTCECSGYSSIVEASNDSEAENTCDAKGATCSIK